MKKVIFCLCISGIIAAIAIYMYSLNGKDKKQVDNSQVSNKNEIKHDIVNNPIVSKDAKEVNLSCHDYFVKEMNEMNFNTELIEKIFDCNEMVFTSWYEYNSKELKRQIGTFSSLKGQTEIQLRLVNAPDVATLVAAVASKHNGIESSNAILDSIPSDSEDGNIVRSLYALNATPNDAMHLAQLLSYDSNQKYIIELYKQSHGDLLYLKSFLKFFELLEENREKAPYAAKVYKEWLYSLLNQMLEMEPESDDADNIYLLLLSQSEPLMEALKSNKEFCNHFFDKYWNDYLKLLNSIPKNDKYKDEKFISYISNDDLWNFLIAYPEKGTQLIKIYGDFAPCFLMNRNFLNNPVAKQRIVSLMLQANDEQKQAFLQIPEDALLLYAQFLEKRQKLEDSDLIKATIILANVESLESASSAKQKLDHWQKLDDNTLKNEKDFASDEFQLKSLIPGYDVCVLICKSFDGREIDGVDIFMAGIDLVTLPVKGSPLQAGMKVLTIRATQTTIKIGVETSIKQTSKKYGKSMFKRIMLAGVKATRQAARHIEKYTKIDITETVETLFKNLRIENATFKKLTGLDARIFMRSDRRVIFDLSVAIKKAVGSNFTKAVAENVFWGTSAHLVLSNPKVQDSIETIKEKIKKINNKKSEEEQWKSDLSAWWMMNQYDEISTDDKPSDKTAQAAQQTE